jgi:hypothetical protein
VRGAWGRAGAVDVRRFAARGFWRDMAAGKGKGAARAVGREVRAGVGVASAECLVRSCQPLSRRWWFCRGQRRTGCGTGRARRRDGTLEGRARHGIEGSARDQRRDRERVKGRPRGGRVSIPSRGALEPQAGLATDPPKPPLDVTRGGWLRAIRREEQRLVAVSASVPRVIDRERVGVDLEQRRSRARSRRAGTQLARPAAK